MKISAKTEDVIKALDGVSYSEWKKIRYIMDNAFEAKKRELERDLKLSNNDKAVTQLLSE